MSEVQLDALMEWVEKLIDFKIECAFSRDALHEEIMESDSRWKLIKTVKEGLTNE